MRRLLGMVLLCLAASASSARANPVVYTDQALWLAATANVINFDYSDLPAFGTNVNGITEGDFTISAGTQNYLYSWGAASGYNLGTGAYLLGAPTLYCSQGQDCYEHETLSAGEHAAAGSNVALYAESGNVTFSGITHNGLTFGATEFVGESSLGFLGVVADAGDWVTSLEFRSDNGSSFSNLILDNTAYGDAADAAAVPEPASVLLLGTGGLGLMATRRRRKRHIPTNT